jgi:uncharacterized RDD family membrane protein YckC
MTAGGPVTASLFRRSIAWWIDLCFISSIAGAVTLAAHMNAITATTTPDGGSAYAVTAGGPFAVVGLVVSALYCIPFWAKLGATPGQLFTGMRVNGVGTQLRLPISAAVVRWFALWGIFGLIGTTELLSGGTGNWPLLLQALWLGFLLASAVNNPLRQGLHDRLAGSVVVKTWLAAALDSVPGLILNQVATGVGQHGAFVPEAWRHAPAPEAAPPPAAVAPVIAGLGRRAGAFILDFFALVNIASVVGAMANVPGALQTTSWMDGTTSTAATFSSSGWSMVVLAIVSAVYCVATWVGVGATPGQWLFGLHVDRLAGPTPLGVNAAIVRWALLWGVPCLLGMPAILIPILAVVAFPGQLTWAVVLLYTARQNSMRQGVHDQLAGSLVVMFAPSMAALMASLRGPRPNEAADGPSPGRPARPS